jgi:hypothetical protein
MTHITHTVTSQAKDGSPVTHTAEALRYWHEADGVIAVEAACCGKVGELVPCQACDGPGCVVCRGVGRVKDEDTRSIHTFYDIGRATADGVIDPVAEITSHVQRVAEHHTAVHRVRSSTLDGLVKHPPASASGKVG